MSISVFAAEDFQKTLTEAGIKPEVLEILAKNELTSREVLCLTTTEELTKIGIVLGQAKLIVKFCTPEKPVESVDVSKLSELDLLNRLAANPKDSTALQALKEKSSIQKATAKTARWVVVNPDKKLNAEETVKYLTFLNKDKAAVQDVFKGKRTTFIEAALGVESDVWLHPLFEGKFITDGLDEFEVDWSGVRVEVLNALLWARKTGHKWFPTHLDGAADLVWQQKALVDPLVDPLKRIVEDYKAALEEKNESALVVDVKKK